MKNEIIQLRNEIDGIDQILREAFERRFLLAKQIAEYKRKNNLPIFDAKREEEVILKNASLINNQELRTYYIDFLKSLMILSKDYQASIIDNYIVGYSGVEGAFAHIACNNIYPHSKPTHFNSFEETFKALLNKEIEKAVIPFENSYTGEVGEVLDLLFKYDVFIEKIESIKVEQNLMSIEGSSLDKIKKIYTHPQAFNQCKEYLRDRNIEFIPFYNTAAAAKEVLRLNDETIGVIASKQTAKYYNLKILAEDIHSSSLNETKFIVLSNRINKNHNRFALMFSVEEGSGKLAPILNEIASNGFNLEAIRSRSLKDLPWQYYFYIEVEGSLNDDRAEMLINNLKGMTQYFKVVGSYSI